MILVAFGVVMGFVGCEKKQKIILREKFVTSDRFELDIRGFPPKNSTAPEMIKIQLAKEAALTNAQLYIDMKFNDEVNSSKDGIIDKFTVDGNSVIIRYVVTKKNIKQLQRK